jgi:hypothetical protein
MSGPENYREMARRRIERILTAGEARCRDCGGEDFSLVCRNCAPSPEKAFTMLGAATINLVRWREWAQFTFLGGGDVTDCDDALRARICAAFDAESKKGAKP